MVCEARGCIRVGLLITSVCNLKKTSYPADGNPIPEDQAPVALIPIHLNYAAPGKLSKMLHSILNMNAICSQKYLQKSCKNVTTFTYLYTEPNTSL